MRFLHLAVRRNSSYLSSSVDPSTTTVLARDTNQAIGLARYAIDFIEQRGSCKNSKIDENVLDRVNLFHTDSVLCGLSALAMKTAAPTILRAEAIKRYSLPSNAPSNMPGAYVFGYHKKVSPEKAIVANSSAVREWDSNGTVFGYNAKLPGHQAGEFGHNDFYPVVIAAAEASKRTMSFDKALRAMLCLDEIRGRLAEVFSLKSYKIDHVVHGAIASAAVYGAIMGATEQQIESAIGMTVAHYIPWRAIRAGHQLSDSKGASAALSTEAAIMSVHRAMMGFKGPKDIFRNPEAVFRYFKKTAGDSPFDIVLSHGGSDFSVMGMHFKLGLYEHQSAGAIQGIINLLTSNPKIAERPGEITKIVIKAYEPAFGIIGDPAKRNPTTRQSADHSMVYIISRLLAKATGQVTSSAVPPVRTGLTNREEAWKEWILTPYDYGHEALNDSLTRELMAKIEFEHGGPEYDAKYPDGIPTSVVIHMRDGQKFDSGLVMYPSGHARERDSDLKAILDNKFYRLGLIAFTPGRFNNYMKRLTGKVDTKNVAGLYQDFTKLESHPPIDGESVEDEHH
jgi:2-methylcitrate dehydratase